MPNTKVTVLMSVYNGEKYLREAVDSILNQTFKDFEFIIINDGSTDKTLKILNSYNDPRIKIISNKKNIGLTRSLNKGLSIAKGEYIARQDANDISMPERLEKQVDFLERNKAVGLIGTYSCIINEKGRILYKRKSPLGNEDISKKLIRGNVFAHGSVMFRKFLLEKVGAYREEFKTSQDYDLWLRFIEITKAFRTSEFLYKWRLLPDSISATKRMQQEKYASLALDFAKERKDHGKDTLQKARETGEEIDLNLLFKEKRIAKDQCIINSYDFWAKSLIKTNNFEEFRIFFFLLLKKNPFRLKTWFLLILVLFKPFKITGIFLFRITKKIVKTFLKLKGNSR
jgi:glycosyltransferase involved in cell wall biosynthesis